MNYLFNQSNIFTGYIKELLKDFNLPCYKVYKEGIPLDEGRTYIYKDSLYTCKNNKLVNKGLLDLNKYTLNISNNFSIDSDLYDSVVHKYLGNYLRFIRDHKNLNLMPLYNCILFEKPTGLNLGFSTGNKDVRVDTDSDSFTYYMASVKFNEEYTIAINSDRSFEIFSCIYTGDRVLEESISVMKSTYKKIPGSTFKNPFLYSSLNNSELSNEHWKQEDNLVLIFKLPKGFKSSIAVLEGDYTENYKSAFGLLLNKLVISDDLIKNKPVLNNINCKLSLLNTCDINLYPFSDLLVEYLLGQTITNLDNIPKNIGRVQSALYSNSKAVFKGEYDFWDSNINSSIYNLLQDDTIEFNSATLQDYNENKYARDRFKYIDIYNDALGFVDKNVEKLLHNVTRGAN